MKFLLALLLSCPLFAGLYWWDTCNPCYEFRIGFDVNYWKACHDLLHIAERGDEQIMLNPEYQFGARIFGRVDQRKGCGFLEFEWDYLNGRTHNEGNNAQVFEFFQSTETLSGFFEVLQRTKYDSVSLKYGCSFFECFYTYVGARWVYIWVDQTVKFPFEQRSFSQYSAGGVEAGIGLSKEIGCGWGLETRFGGIGVFGTRYHVFVDEFGTNRYSNSHCTGGMEVRAGITYSYSCGGWWTARGELGYELVCYFKPLLYEQPTISPKNVFGSDFALAGPYLGISLIF